MAQSRRTIDWSHALAAAPAPRTPEEAEPKDFNVHVRVRNGRLLAAIRKAGYSSMAEFCRAHHLPIAPTNAYATMRRSPYSTIDGLPTKAAKHLAMLLNAEVEDLFPQRLLAAAMASASRPVDLNLTDDQIEFFLQQPPVTPEQYLRLSNAQDNIGRALRTLTPREEHVLISHHGLNGEREQTLEQVGETYRVTRERVRQIELRGMRKLAHPSRRHFMARAADDLGWWVPARALEEPIGKALREEDAPRLERKPPPPDEPAQRVLRRRVFPDERQRRPVVQHTCSPDVVRLLSIPSENRSDPVKRALAYHLEQEFGRRGAGILRVHQVDEQGNMLSAEHVQMRKYNYLMANLDALWAMFPPAPVLDNV